MKKVLITAGGTTEHIDDVRVLTNISTGQLGAMIADCMAFKIDYEIFYVHAPTAEKPLVRSDRMHYIQVTDVASLMKVMEKLVPEMDIVIHAMAVSDFGFKPLHEKLKSNDPETFIESLRERIIQNPKVLSYIKLWNPKTFLVSFKFEVGLTHQELIKCATYSCDINGCDLVVANDLKEMEQAQEHIAYVIDNSGIEIKGEGKFDIAKKLWETINTKMA